MRTLIQKSERFFEHQLMIQCTKLTPTSTPKYWMRTAKQPEYHQIQLTCQPKPAVNLIRYQNIAAKTAMVMV